MKNVLLGGKPDSMDQQGIQHQGTQQQIYQQPPQQPTQQPSMIRQTQKPVQNDKLSFVSYQDLHSRQYVDTPTETSQE